MRHFYTFILIISFTYNYSAQAQKDTMRFSVDHYAINVSDLQRSVDYYQLVFGIKEIYNGTEKKHIRWFRLGDQQELHIISVENLKLQIPKGVHLALTTADVSLFIKHLETLEITYYDWPGNKGSVSIRPDKVKQIYIQDPDGYWIEINDGEKRFK
jgi:catechol 2,3-dioxygenase-like lactoylglutathione lyase family enzyme